jgi:hypothetical protein
MRLLPAGSCLCKSIYRRRLSVRYDGGEMRRYMLLWVLSLLFLATCTGEPTGETATSRAETSTSPASTATVTATAAPVGTNERNTTDGEYQVPQLLPFDAIRPVYQPEFVVADQALLDDNQLIIGVTLEGEAKAYPISVLRRREMVNDELAGIPILVTW